MFRNPAAQAKAIAKARAAVQKTQADMAVSRVPSEQVALRAKLIAQSANLQKELRQAGKGPKRLLMHAESTIDSEPGLRFEVSSLSAPSSTETTRPAHPQTPSGTTAAPGSAGAAAPQIRVPAPPAPSSPVSPPSVGTGAGGVSPDGLVVEAEGAEAELLAKAESGQPWYKNPWIVGGAAVLGFLWFTGRTR